MDAMHGPKETDLQMLALLREHSIPHQVVLSKVDRLKGRPVIKGHKRTPDEAQERIVTTTPFQDRLTEIRALVQPGDHSGLEALGEILCTCAVTEKRSRPVGIDALRWAVLASVGLDRRGYVDVQLPDVVEYPRSKLPEPELPADLTVSRAMNYTPLA